MIKGSTPKAPGSRGPQVDAYVRVCLVYENLQARLAPSIRSHGLSLPQYNVLRILRGAGAGGLSCREIGQRMIQRVPDVTRLVDRLVARGLACRDRSPTDRRVVEVRATQKALDLLGILDQPVIEAHLRQFEALDESELESLNRVLDKLLAEPLP